MPDAWLEVLWPLGTDWRNERPYVLIPVGYPASGCMVPDLERKPVEDTLVRR